MDSIFFDIFHLSSKIEIICNKTDINNFSQNYRMEAELTSSSVVN